MTKLSPSTEGLELDWLAPRAMGAMADRRAREYFMILVVVCLVKMVVFVDTEEMLRYSSSSVLYISFQVKQSPARLPLLSSHQVRLL
jgi:hypothetical protein